MDVNGILFAILSLICMLCVCKFISYVHLTFSNFKRIKGTIHFIIVVSILSEKKSETKVLRPIIHLTITLN